MRTRLSGALACAFTIAIGQSSGSGQAVFACAPGVVRPGDTVTLRFGRGHPAELMVRRPDGIPFFLVYERDDSMPAGLQPMMSTDAFRQLLELELPVASAEATPWVAGYDRNQKVFAPAGEYTFLLREILETDIKYPTFTCRVRYEP